jgi:hypothetical protein
MWVTGNQTHSPSLEHLDRLAEAQSQDNAPTSKSAAKRCRRVQLGIMSHRNGYIDVVLYQYRILKSVFGPILTGAVD